MRWKTEWWKSLPQEKNKEKRMKGTEESLRDLWDNIKHTNIASYGFQKEKRERARENI